MRWFGRLLCRFGFHDYASIHKISANIEHVGCTRCKKQWGMHHDLQVILEWEIAEVLTHQFYTPDPVEVERRLNPANYTKKKALPS